MTVVRDDVVTFVAPSRLAVAVRVVAALVVVAAFGRFRDADVRGVVVFDEVEGMDSG